MRGACLGSRERWQNARRLTVKEVASWIAPLLRELGFRRRGSTFLRKENDLWQFVSVCAYRGRHIANEWSDQGWISIRVDAASIALRRALGKHAVTLAGFAADSLNPPLHPDVGAEVGAWDRGGPVEETLDEIRRVLICQVPAFFDGLTLDELAHHAQPGLACGMFAALRGDRREVQRQCWNLWVGRADHGRFIRRLLQLMRILGRLGSKIALQLGYCSDWRLRAEIILRTLAGTNPAHPFDRSMLDDEYYRGLTRRAAGNASGLSPTELQAFIRNKIEFDDDPDIYMIIDDAMCFRPELDAMLKRRSQ